LKTPFKGNLGQRASPSLTIDFEGASGKGERSEEFICARDKRKAKRGGGGLLLRAYPSSNFPNSWGRYLERRGFGKKEKAHAVKAHLRRKKKSSKGNHKTLWFSNELPLKGGGEHHNPEREI